MAESKLIPFHYLGESPEDALKRRAHLAWFRIGGNSQQPNWDSSTVESCKNAITGKKVRYVALRSNTNGLLAVYRVRGNGMLKRLKRWPKELERDRCPSEIA
jgi:hypothetical protein